MLGKTFTVAARSPPSPTRRQAELEPLLAGLVRKEVLGVQSDPRSPERGQYGFLQDLVRHVAYETLSKRERKSRHLAAAAHLRRAFPDEDEVAEVLACPLPGGRRGTHRAPTTRPRAAAQAREMLTRAGERAASLGALDEGRRYYDQAARSGRRQRSRRRCCSSVPARLALRANQPAEARERLERAHSLNLAGRGREGGRAGERGACRSRLRRRRATTQALVRLEQVTAELERAGALVELAGALAAVRPGQCDPRTRRAGGGRDRSSARPRRAPAAAGRLRRGPDDQGSRAVERGTAG